MTLTSLILAVSQAYFLTINYTLFYFVHLRVEFLNECLEFRSCGVEWYPSGGIASKRELEMTFIRITSQHLDFRLA